MNEPSAMDRVLFVHAHPDDESISTGGTIATLSAAGAAVTVLTCTRGEAGEVIPEDLAHLRENQDELARHRESELAAALRILGVTDHRYLGSTTARHAGLEPRRYRDSGMVAGERGPEPVASPRPDSLIAADPEEVWRDVAAVIDDVQPTAVVSYNSLGGYGHPDHIAAHRAARRAAANRGVTFYAIQPEDSPSRRTRDVDVSPVLQVKKAALAAHRSQVVLSGESFALSNGVEQPIGTVERFLALPAPRTRRPIGVVAIELVIGIVLGLAAAALLTAVHQWSVRVVGIPVPVGLLAALATVAAVLLGLRLLRTHNTMAIAAATGIIGLVALLALPSAGGSIIVPGNLAGFGWTFGPTLIAFAVLGWPRTLSRSAARPRSSARPATRPAR